LVGDRLAVTVSIERDRARVKGRDEPIDQALRVTQVFRWEDGSWKLVHRHADPLMERKAPSRG
jgi:ketosteroid isomerase-like protein